MFGDHLLNVLEDVFQFQVSFRLAFHVQHVNIYKAQLCRLVLHLNDSIPHDVGAGVNAEDAMGLARVFQSLLSFRIERYRKIRSRIFFETT